MLAEFCSYIVCSRFLSRCHNPLHLMVFFRQLSLPSIVELGRGCFLCIQYVNWTFNIETLESSKMIAVTVTDDSLDNFQHFSISKNLKCWTFCTIKNSDTHIFITISSWYKNMYTIYTNKVMVIALVFQ